MNGILVIDKPAGLTSHNVVARLRRILKTKKIGHTGTLDPFATGVLVMLVGKATRLAQFLDKDEKAYEALVRFGYETDTGDITGSPKSQVPARDGQSQVPGTKSEGDAESHVPSSRSQSDRDELLEKVVSVLPQFRGEIDQVPPMYSAKKVEGKKLYELARKGVEIERKAVRVTISELEIFEPGSARWSDGETREYGEHPVSDLGHETWDMGPPASGPDLGLRIAVSAGTYIRTLAEDIARAAGSAAHLAELRRTRAGRFDLSQAVTLEELENMEDSFAPLVPMNDAVGHLPERKLDEEEVARIRNGIKIPARIADEAVQIVRLTAGDELVAIGFLNEKEQVIQPRLVF